MFTCHSIASVTTFPSRHSPNRQIRFPSTLSGASTVISPTFSVIRSFTSSRYGAINASIAASFATVLLT